MESAVTAPVSGHVKRVVVHEGELMLRSWKSNKSSDVNAARRGLHRPRGPRCGNCALADLFGHFQREVVMRFPVTCVLSVELHQDSTLVVFLLDILRVIYACAFEGVL